MECRATRLHGCLNDAFDIEVAVSRAPGAKHDNFTASGIRRIAVRVAYRKYRHDTELIATTSTAHRDFAAVGDKQAMK